MVILDFNIDKTPVDIIDEIRNMAFDPEVFGSLDNYLIWLAQNLWKFNSIGIQIPEGPIESKCESVVKQLQKHGFIRLVH